jgi:hypothetical protein
MGGVRTVEQLITSPARPDQFISSSTSASSSSVSVHRQDHTAATSRIGVAQGSGRPATMNRQNTLLRRLKPGRNANSVGS